MSDYDVGALAKQPAKGKNLNLNDLNNIKMSAPAMKRKKAFVMLSSLKNSFKKVAIAINAVLKGRRAVRLDREKALRIASDEAQLNKLIEVIGSIVKSSNELAGHYKELADIFRRMGFEDMAKRAESVAKLLSTGPASLYQSAQELVASFKGLKPAAAKERVDYIA